MRTACIRFGLVAVMMVLLGCSRSDPIKEMAAAWAGPHSNAGLIITNPLDGTLFPPDIAAPTIRWKDTNSKSDRWLVMLRFGQGDSLAFLAFEQSWRPDRSIWESAKEKSRNYPATLIVAGVNHRACRTILSGARITFGTSADSVVDPLFYREVNLPFKEAVKDPSRIQWRFGSIALGPPPVVLENLPVCGNCHSFSTDGRVLGMDVDYANDKASYVVTNVARLMTLATSDLITWSDYRRNEKDPTYGLLSQVSPDGRYAISTVKDRSVFVAVDNLAFSQLFFPIQGILAYYDRERKTYRALAGAGDPAYVQSNPSWSPDGKYIVFARSKAMRLRSIEGTRRVLLTLDECREFITGGATFLFDLYRVPFNEGGGGLARPLPGASADGMSNYFAKYSPDGKWIVFCKSKSFMLLQADSKLYIMPSEGGQPRLMRCNTGLMNSWHSWSSNGRWLVFSTKANGPYTRLALTHVDGQGEDTPPVILENLSQPDRAANIPEFVKAPAGAIAKISERFIDDYSLWRAGVNYRVEGDMAGAESKFRSALAMNARNVEAYLSLGNVLAARGLLDSAKALYQGALRIDPRCANAHLNIGNALLKTSRVSEAITHYRKAVSLNPDDAMAHANLANAYSALKEYDKALPHNLAALRLQPEKSAFYYCVGLNLFRLGKINEAIAKYRKGIELNPKSSSTYKALAVALTSTGRIDEAIDQYLKAIQFGDRKPVCLNACADLLMKQGRQAEAMELYQEARQMQSDVPSEGDGLNTD